MRRYIILFVIVAQLAVLAYMVAKREVILVTGQQIFLRTAPIDPRDPFRGDFVRLTYALNTVYSKQIRGSVMDHLHDKGYQVYAVLKPAENDLYSLDFLTHQQPHDQVYIKGQIINNQGWSRGRGAANVKYGLEQLFVAQGTGREIERIRGTRSGVQVPMEVQVAIGGDGTALLRDYRWSKLGVQLEMLRFNRGNRRNDDNTNQNQATTELSPKVKVSLKNVSDTALVIVDWGDHCGFALVPVRWAAKTYTPVDTTCNAVPLAKQAFITLDPDQSYQAEMDLSKPRWHMRIKNSKGVTSEGEIGIDNNSELFRIVYQSPKPSQFSQVTVAVKYIWQGQLPSRAFNARGRID